MPKFLEIDYFRQYQEQRNQLLSNCLLNEPRHIALLSVTSTKDGVLDSLLQLFGKMTETATGCEVEIKDDFSSLGTTFTRDLGYVLFETPEKLNTIRNMSSYASIPSSSPDSPLPPNIQELLVANGDFNFNEMKDADTDLKVQEIQEIDLQDILEEIQSEVKLDDLRLIPTSPSMLAKKLKLVRISDPFLMQFEQQLNIIKCDRELCYDFIEYSQCFEKEVSQKEILSENDLDDQHLLEEPIIPILLKSDESSSRIDLISSGLSTIDISCDDGCVNAMKDLSSGTDLSIQDIEHLSNLKEACDLDILCTPVAESCKNQENDCNLMLESPMQSSISSQDGASFDLVRTSVQVLPNDISPLCERHFLPTASKMELETILRDRDKALGNMLSMTLATPDIQGLQHNTLAAFIREIYNLCSENMNCNLEVSLPWDPFILLRNELVEAKGTLHSELKLCCTETVENFMSDVDLEIVRLKDVADSWSDEYVSAIEERTSYKNNKESVNVSASDINCEDTAENKLSFSKSRNLDRIEHAAVKAKQYSARPTMNASQQEKDKFKGNWKNHNTPFNSPLDMFVLLRTGEKTPSEIPSSSLPVAMVPPRSIIKAAKVKPFSVVKEKTSSAKNEILSKLEKGVGKEAASFPPMKIARHENIPDADVGRKANSDFPDKKLEIITVDISNVYQEVICGLEEGSAPLLRFLKERKVISQDLQFCNIKPDITRFLIRQQEKRHEHSTINAYEEDTMKGIICLHALALSSDAVVNYGMLAAIGTIEVIEERYSEFVGDLLKPIRQQLIKKQRKIEAQNQLHSKTEMIFKMVNELLYIPDTKIIILVRRYFDYCFKTLENALSCLKSAIVVKYPKEIDGERLLDFISKGNVIIAELSCELQFCPWKCMTYVFEYEYREESEWFRLCFDENPNLKGFYALNCFPKKFINDQGKETSLPSIETAPNQSKPWKCFSEHIIIGSRRITSNQKLLCQLENKWNILLIERDYTPLYKMFGKTECYLQPDIIVDERTCIVIINGHEIQTNEGSNIPWNIISSMKLKCLECYVLLAFLDLDSKCCFPYDAIESLSQVLLASSQTKNVNHTTKFHLLYVFSHEEAAEWIFLICNEARDTSTVWNAQDWGNRFWLTEEMSLHEKFLLSLPCFTSFTAQIALTTAPLKRILGLTLDEMRNILGLLPLKIIESFHATVNDDKLEDTFIYSQLMNTGIPNQNLLGMAFNSQQTNHVSNYDSQFVSVYDQQYNSFKNDNEYEGHTHTPRSFPSKNNDEHKTSHVKYSSGFFTDFEEEETSIWNKNPTNSGVRQRFSITAENETEEDSILKDKDVDAYGLHKNVSRQQNLMNPNPNGHAPKWRLVQSSNSNGRLATSQRSSWQKDHGIQQMRNKYTGTPSTIRLTPSKRRILTFEKDPNSRDGQTRLSFL